MTKGGLLAAHGGLCGLEGSGGFWRVLEGSGGFRRVLEGSGGFWRVLEGSGGLLGTTAANNHINTTKNNR